MRGQIKPICFFCQVKQLNLQKVSSKPSSEDVPEKHILTSFHDKQNRAVNGVAQSWNASYLYQGNVCQYQPATYAMKRANDSTVNLSKQVAVYHLMKIYGFSFLHFSPIKPCLC